MLPAIEDCHDCADFILVPLLWCRAGLWRRRSRRGCSRASTARSSAIATGWTSRATTCSGISPRTTRCCSTPPPISPAHLLPDARFVRSGRLGAEQSQVGARTRARLARPFREMGDGRVQLGALFPDRPQGPDRAVGAGARRRYARARARGHRAAARDRRPLGASRHADRRAGPLLRAHAARRRARSNCPASRACCGARAITAAASMRCRSSRSACATTASTCRPSWRRSPSTRRDDAQEWCFAQGQDRIAKLYHYKTRDYRDGHGGALPLERVGLSGDGAAPAARRQSRRADLDQPSRARPSSPAMAARPTGAGRGTLPRVHQYRGLAVVLFDCAAGAARFHPRLVPAIGVRRRRRSTATWRSLAGGGGMALLKGSGPLAAGRRAGRPPATSSGLPAARHAGSSGSATRRANGELESLRKRALADSPSRQATTAASCRRSRLWPRDLSRRRARSKRRAASSIRRTGRSRARPSICRSADVTGELQGGRHDRREVSDSRSTGRATALWEEENDQDQTAARRPRGGPAVDAPRRLPATCASCGIPTASRARSCRTSSTAS